MIDLAPAISKALAPHKHPRPRQSNHASRIGHPCVRYLYHYRVDWDKAKTRSDDLQGAMMQGARMENILMAYFKTEIGPHCNPPLTIVGDQMPSNDALLREHEIGMRIDGILAEEKDGRFIHLGVLDLKTAGSNPYRGYYDLNSLAKHTWSSMYKAQAMLGSFAHNMERCFLLFVDKGNIYAHWKIIEFPLDLAYVESLLQKAKRINEAVKTKTAPSEKIDRPDWCKECEYAHLCMPDLQIGAETKIITSTEVCAAVTNFVRLKPLRAECDAAEKSMKGMLVAGQNAVAGAYMLEWTEVKPRGRKPYWKLKIKGE